MMLTYYVLSHDSHTVVDNERVNVYRWVKIGATQIKEGMTALYALPDDKPGAVVRYGIEGRGPVLLRVKGDGTLRELSNDETDTSIIQIPRI